MPTYAGVPLCPSTPELSAWVEKFIPLLDVVEFGPSGSMNKLYGGASPYPDQRKRPIKLGSLWWPSGASRYAVGSYVATESQLHDIRPALTDSGATLSISDGTSEITPTIYMLPPRPLAQNPPDSAHLTKWTLPVLEADFASKGEPCYLLTLVDQRYFWWQTSSTVELNPGDTTYSDLVDAIAADLGISISYSIPDAFLKPSAHFAPYLAYLPLLLDLIAFETGQRVAVVLDGTVALQNPSVALSSQQTQLIANTSRMAGGLMAFDAP